ncbi:MAG TPA: homoserine kinase [bacterium]|nr:homoserine kinase [bacterium]HOL34488.1 homoserine kinase [bacterium]HPP08454.1 homoserine kinase [bacterium]
MKKIKKVIISVPGCIGNVGSGFDCMGISIKLFNRFIFENSEYFSIFVSSSDVDSSKNNLCYKSFEKVCKLLGKDIPAIKLSIDNKIPAGKGLGSSGTAVLAGIIAGLIFSGEKVVLSKVLKIGKEIEGHLDDIAASFLGGLVVIAENNGEIVCKQFDIPSGVSAVFFITEDAFPTEQARKILPGTVSMSDVIFNLSRTCLVPVAFIEKDKKLLGIATQDRLHQIYREKFYPHFRILYDSAMQSGAAGCCLSGAGPSVVAFCFDDTEKIVKKWKEVAMKHRIVGEIKVIEPGGKTTWTIY